MNTENLHDAVIELHQDLQAADPDLVQEALTSLDTVSSCLYAYESSGESKAAVQAAIKETIRRLVAAAKIASDVDAPTVAYAIVDAKDMAKETQ